MTRMWGRPGRHGCREARGRAGWRWCRRRGGAKAMRPPQRSTAPEASSRPMPRPLWARRRARPSRQPRACRGRGRAPDHEARRRRNRLSHSMPSGLASAALLMRLWMACSRSCRPPAGGGAPQSMRVVSGTGREKAAPAVERCPAASVGGQRLAAFGAQAAGAQGEAAEDRACSGRAVRAAARHRPARLSPSWRSRAISPAMIAIVPSGCPARGRRRRRGCRGRRCARCAGGSRGPRPGLVAAAQGGGHAHHVPHDDPAETAKVSHMPARCQCTARPES